MSPLALPPTVHRSVLLLGGALVGCARQGGGEDQLGRSPVTLASSQATRPSATAPPASASTAPSALPAFGPVRIAPAVPPFERGILSHVDVFGWSSDSERFGYCATSDGRGDRKCVFVSPSGAKETIRDWNDAKEEQDPKLVAKQKARERELALVSKSGEWAFADELEIAWDIQGGLLLRIGARVRGHAPSFSILLRDRDQLAMEGGIHPEGILVSPDGKWLGAMSHTFHGEFSDAFEVRIVPVARAAAQAYNDAGYEEHKASKWAAAAELFRRAVDADPAFARPKYNLACAYARLGDPRTESALRAAVASAGSDAAQTKRRARSDPDFTTVAQEAWFEDALR